ncbi:MAG: hypothetical protein R3266_08880 [Gemmatimonadota bacterium]|nr:hypothetical protein [Gemmatimonadota bacterium]
MCPVALAAQTIDPGVEPSPFEVQGFVGVLQPLANLSENPDAFGTVLTPNVAFGAEATLWVSPRLGLSAGGVLSPTDLDAFATQAPGTIELPEDLGSATWAAGTVSLTYRIVTSGSAGSVEPYFALGGGIRHVSFDEIAEPEAESATDPAATLAAGLRIEVLDGLLMRIEVRDVASFYASPVTDEDKLQNDVLVTLGLGFR